MNNFGAILKQLLNNPWTALKQLILINKGKKENRHFISSPTFKGNYWTTIEQLLNNSWTTIEHFFKNFWKTLEQLLNNSWTTLEQLINNTWTTLQQL